MESPVPYRRLRSWLLAAVAFVLAFDVAFLWQRDARAWDSELGGSPQEATHYLQGLLIHDYLAAGTPESPVSFGVEFGRHYPADTFGDAPSLFGLLEGGWMFAFGTSPKTALLLQTTLAGLLGMLLALPKNGRLSIIRLLLALGFLSLPAVRAATATLGPELLSAVLIVAGIVVFWRAITRSRREKRAEHPDTVGMPVTSAVPGLLMLGALCAGIGAVSFLRPTPVIKNWSGFAPLAEIILEDTENAGGSILVASDAAGDGAFIAAIAGNEKRPGHTIERASRVLVEKGDNPRLRSKFSDDEALIRHLTTGEYRFIVFDDSIPENGRALYHDQLRRVLRADMEAFWEVKSALQTRHGIVQEGPVQLFRVRPPR